MFFFFNPLSKSPPENKIKPLLLSSKFDEGKKHLLPLVLREIDPVGLSSLLVKLPPLVLTVYFSSTPLSMSPSENKNACFSAILNKR